MIPPQDETRDQKLCGLPCAQHEDCDRPCVRSTGHDGRHECKNHTDGLDTLLAAPLVVSAPGETTYVNAIIPMWHLAALLKAAETAQQTAHLDKVRACYGMDLTKHKAPSPTAVSAPEIAAARASMEIAASMLDGTLERHAKFQSKVDHLLALVSQQAEAQQASDSEDPLTSYGRACYEEGQRNGRHWAKVAAEAREAQQAERIRELELKLRIYANGDNVNQALVDDIDRWRDEKEAQIEAALRASAASPGEKNDDDAGLIHQTIPDVDGTEPRPIKEK